MQVFLHTRIVFFKISIKANEMRSSEAALLCSWRCASSGARMSWFSKHEWRFVI